MLKRNKITAVLLMACCGLLMNVNLLAQTVWLDELDLTTATQGYGLPTKNKSIDGRKMTIAGNTFERGFGSHAESSLTVLLNGAATSFSAAVGIDDEVKAHDPAAEFVVYGDGKKMWSSGIMHAGDAARLCTVDLKGINKFELLVTDGGNGNYYDHVNWADAKFQTTGATTFKTFSPVANVRYILTPKPSAQPKINGASVFGIRPGSPFLFRVAATGIRPMVFFSAISDLKSLRFPIRILQNWESMETFKFETFGDKKTLQKLQPLKTS